MARIAGVDIPREKRVEIGLTYIYGIGRTTANKILAKTGINPDTRCKDLTDEEVAKLRDVIQDEYTVEGDLRREIAYAARSSTTTDGYTLTDIVIVANNCGGLLTHKLQILWQTGDRGSCVYLIALADTCAIMNNGTRTYPAVVANLNIACDIRKRLYRNILTQLRIRVNISQRTNHTFFKFKIKN